MLNFREACTGWFDRWGRFNADRPMPTLDPASNNNNLYHAHYLAILDLYGEISEGDGKHLEALIRMCQVQPGLIKRDPYSGMEQKHDDIIGLCAAASLTDRADLALEVLEYCESNEWCYSVKEPEVYDITLDISRLPGVEPFIRLCAGKDLGLTDQLALGLSMLITAFRHDGESGVLMDWLKFRVIQKKQKPWLLKALCIVWSWKMGREKLNMGASFSRYFPINGKMHPFALYLYGKL